MHVCVADSAPRSNTPAMILNTQVPNPTATPAEVFGSTHLHTMARTPFSLNYGPRPEGTPGRDGFDLKATIGLQQHEYSLCLRILRYIAYNSGVDERQSISYQDEHILQKVFNQFIETFPEFKGFQDRFWAPRALLYVALKSSSDAWRRNNPELAAAQVAARAAAKANKRRNKGQPNPKGRPKGKAKAIAKSKTQKTMPADDDSIERISKNIGDMSIDQVAGDAAGNTAGDEADDTDLEQGPLIFFSPAQPVPHAPSHTPAPSSTHLAPPTNMPCADTPHPSHTAYMVANTPIPASAHAGAHGPSLSPTTSKNLPGTKHV
ncbi:hypothetical protein CTheo_8760 [Ceratobasidium theobromae]|uniref:Uncharacterized protein n=1 Tax=Ceratobasidium theobromae TaxID=1582974 RepID=A0A5N5Q7Y3_9AGAM|nr:hypothetical protein CTheo_8760 [Ceratobasidium theobromae]